MHRLPSVPDPPPPPRLQVPSGELTSTQLRKLAECIRPYGEKGCGDITTRANIQLRGITMEDAGSVYDAVQEMGLTSVMTGMDNVRNLTGSPIAGLDPHELCDVRPMLEELQVRPPLMLRSWKTPLRFGSPERRACARAKCVSARSRCAFK